MGKTFKDNKYLPKEHRKPKEGRRFAPSKGRYKEDIKKNLDKYYDSMEDMLSEE